MCYIIRMYEINNELELTKSRRDWLTASQFDKRRRRELAGGYEKKFPLMGISYIDLPFKYAPYRYFKWEQKNL